MLSSKFDLTDAIHGKKVSRKRTSDRSSDEIPDGTLSAVAESADRTHQNWCFRCPMCDEPMRVCEERDLTEFGGLDVKLHRLECDACGMLTGRVFHPSVGYDSNLVR